MNKQPMKNTKPNQIIDIEAKGNVVRFYLGENGKQWGDDWDDVPYEHNAGRVYKEFVKGYKDIVFDFDKCLSFPADGHSNSPYSKEMMVKREVPCLVVSDKEYWLFEEALADSKSIKYYFGNII